MGILNITPDSFSDGGKYLSVESAIVRAKQLVDAGASILDVGGVSTRPGAAEVSVEEEKKRVLPVLEALRSAMPRKVLLSLDSFQPEVVDLCASYGFVDVINDVFAGRVQSSKNTLDIAAKHRLALVLMHMQGTPADMQKNPQYKNCVEDVVGFLRERALLAQNNGVVSVCVDPGIGFGKTTEHNLELLTQKGFTALKELGFPILIGLSRKRFLTEVARREGNLGDLSLPERDLLSKRFERQCLNLGAKIIRSHKLPIEIDY